MAVNKMIIDNNTLFNHIFEYSDDYQFLICKQHHAVVIKDHLRSHLSTYHNLNLAACRVILKYIEDQNISTVSTFDELKRRILQLCVSPVPRFPHLQFYSDGLLCQLSSANRPCRYICRDRSAIQKHCKDEHGWVNPIPKGAISEAAKRTLQMNGFQYPYKTGIQCQKLGQGGWIHPILFETLSGSKSVDGRREEHEPQKEEKEGGIDIDESSNNNDEIIDLWHQTEKQLTKQAIRLQTEHSQSAEQFGLAPLGTYPICLTPWLELTQWHKYLHGQTLLEVAHLTDLPAKDDDDIALSLLLTTFDELIEQSRENILSDRVNTFDLHRVNSFVQGRSFHKPLLIKLQEKTYKTYKSVWKQLLCFVYRLVAIEDAATPKLHYILSDAQGLALDRLLVELRSVGEKVSNSTTSKLSAESDYPSSEFEPGWLLSKAAPKRRKGINRIGDAHMSILGTAAGVGNPTNCLLDLCLEFCISLLDHCLKGNVYDSLVVGFLAAIGINVKENGFYDPTNYTTKLSALIKLAQIMVLQQAIRAVDLGKAEFPADLIDEMQTRFVAYGSRSPINWAQKLRAYGSKIRDTTEEDNGFGYLGIWGEGDEEG
jgi:hypothetical protein